MPVEVLIHAFDHAKALKGAPQDVREDAELLVHPWGRRETLPNFVIIRIVDASLSDVSPFLVTWKNQVSFTIEIENGTKRRWRLDVAPNIVKDFGSGKGISPEMITFLEDQHGAVVITRAANRAFAILDVPLTDFQAIEDELLDRFEEVVAERRFRFATVNIDAAIAVGGRLTTNSVPILNQIVDRQA